jgi:putative ABC transport system permease protein
VASPSRFLYRRFASLLPAAFRSAAGRDLEEAALACLERERRRLGRPGVVLTWMRLLGDTFVTAVVLRWPGWLDRRDPYARQRRLAGRDRRPAFEAFMDTIRKDLRYALRSLRRQPGFAFVTILTLALGIGANTAVFSVVNGVLLRPLPYPHPDRIELITSQFPDIGFDQFWISPPEFVEYRDHNQAFEAVGAYAVRNVTLGSDPPSRPMGALVSAELMPALGVPPLRGRWFTQEDTLPHAPPVVILSYELWQRDFGGDTAIVGRNITVNDLQQQVVGIMPAGFDVHDSKVEIWAPLTLDPSTFSDNRGSHYLYLVGRLKDGIGIDQARADLQRLLEQWQTFAPGAHTPSVDRHRLRIDPLREDIVGGVERALLILQAAVGFVLLIACANLANLLVARADARMREYALRTALGAGRGRLFSQLLVEGLLLTTVAAAAGVGLAYAGLNGLLAINSEAIPRAAGVTIDLPVLGFTLVVAIVTGLVFALVPLAHLGPQRISQAVREAGTRTTAGASRVWMRSTLVVVEVALAVTLVVGAGLLIRSFLNLTRVDMGFNRANLSTFGVILPRTAYAPQQRADFYDRLTTRLRALPGVENVAAMTGLPPLRSVNANDTDFEHIPNNRPRGELPVENVDFYQDVTVGYAETMGIPVIQGRSFERGDVGGAPVVLVNEALVRKFFPGRDPIGGRLKPGYDMFDKEPWFTIVGVLKDVKQGGVAEAAGTELYVLAEQEPRLFQYAPSQMNFVVRSSLPLAALAGEFKRSVQELDPKLPIVAMRSMDDVVGVSIARPRFLTMLLGIFAGLALLLAAVGTYGILAYLVAERRHEIGIRMALGADRGRIMRLVLVRGLALSAAGLAIGLASAVALTRVMASLLFNVAPTDPATLAGVTAVISLVAAGACIIPAWRATRVDPLVVLRDTGA